MFRPFLFLPRLATPVLRLGVIGSLRPSDVLQKPRVLEVMARGWESLNVQIVLFTLGDPELNAVYNTTEDVLQVPCVLEVMARGWESLNVKAEVARVHRDRHCHETMVWYCPLEDVVARSPTLEENYRRATTQGPIIERGSLVFPGLASQRDRFQTAKQGRLLYQRHCS